MITKIIQEPETITETLYDLVFDCLDCKGASYSFPCSAGGVVDVVNLPPGAASNLRRCLNQEHNVNPPEVREYVRTWKQDRIGLCECGEQVNLHGFTNTCSRCGRDYNWNGTELAPRRFWGEETGETAADILCGCPD